MSEIAPWLVVGGAALVVLCAVVTLAAVGRAIRRGRRSATEGQPARSALRSALVGDAPDDELMPLLLAAALEATGADAAVVTLLRAGHRHRSYSVNLDLRATRSALDALVAAGASPQPAADVPRDRLVFPIDRDGLSAVLAVYWRDEALGGGRPPVPRRIATDVEELIATAFRRLPPNGVDDATRVPPDASHDEDERVRWTRLAELNGTLEPTALLEKIVGATVTDCGADAAAARVSVLPEQPLSAASQFAPHEAQWVDSVLGSRTLAASVTRFFGLARDAVAEGEVPIATAIVAPLRGAGEEVVGSLVAAWRRDLADDADRAVGDIETLVEDARVALANATRFQHLQAAAGRDPSTGLFDERYFIDRLADAVEAAERTAQPLLVSVLAVSELEAVDDDVHLAALEDALVTASARIAKAVGNEGVACRVGLAEFAAIMPGADTAGVGRLLDALVRDLPDRVAGEGRLKWTTSLAQLDSSESADELWTRARRDLHSRRRPAPTTVRPAASPVVSGPMRLSFGESTDDWTLRRPDPKEEQD